MNVRIRKASQRGTVDHGWLHANSSFSFGLLNTKSLIKIGRPRFDSKNKNKSQNQSIRANRVQDPRQYHDHPHPELPDNLVV